MKPFREFELLVSRIETALAPTGARVKSPDKIRDRVTGKMREVDASIRSPIGSVEMLITVECRKRSRRSDVTWIEQLATKRSNIGASHTIAVASKPFSPQARAVGEANGISTRAIQEVSDAEILDWVNTLQVNAVTASYNLGRLFLTFHEEQQDARLLPEAEALWTERGIGAQIFLELEGGRTLSLTDIVGMVHKRTLSPGTNPITVTLPPQSGMFLGDDPLLHLIRDVPVDAGPVERAYMIEFTSEKVGVNTTSGPLKLKSVTFELVVSLSSERLPPDRVVSYVDDKTSIADYVEHRLPSKGGGITMTQVRRRQS